MTTLSNVPLSHSTGSLMYSGADSRRKRIIRSNYSTGTVASIAPSGHAPAGDDWKDSDVSFEGSVSASKTPASPLSGASLSEGETFERDRPPSLEAICEWLAPAAPTSCTELILRSSLDGQSETVRVDSPLVVIGRDSRCDLKLDHPDVSRKHACLHMLRDRILCMDLCSRTGVFWGEERRPAGWLEGGEGVRIGPYELRVSARDVSVAELSLPAAEVLFSPCSPRGAGNSESALQFLKNDDGVLQEAPIRRPITLIGRSGRCKFRLRDAGISRVDSSLIVTPQGVRLTNLLGRGRVRVNGERVSSVVLAPGDELTVGRFRMRFVTTPPTNRSGAEEFWDEAATAPGMESLPPALQAMFLGLRREMREQFRLQSDLTVGLMETLRRDLMREIRAELLRLIEIGEEIRSARRELPSSRRGNASVAPHAGVGDRSDHDEREFEEPPSQNGAAEHALITRRLHNLEDERVRRWRNLLSLVGSGN